MVGYLLAGEYAIIAAALADASPRRLFLRAAAQHNVSMLRQEERADGHQALGRYLDHLAGA